jgi:DNA-binding FadR family transcriptional regulator
VTLTRPGSANLHSRVVDALGQDIVDGRVAVGSILSPEDLRERFGVSRSVVRESLRALESMGMTRARPQVGTRVLPPEDWNLLHPQIVEWRGRGAGYLDQLEEVLEVRFGIELVAARLAAHRMADESIAELARWVDAMQAAFAAGDGIAYLDADAAFHAVLLDASGNAVIAQFSNTVTAVTRTRRQDPGRTLTDLTPASIADHRELAEAVADHDADRAESASRAVVLHTLVEFREHRGRTGREL